MGNATFYPIDETAFDDDRQVSTAHMKRLEESAAYCKEERWYTSTWCVPLIGDETSQGVYDDLKPPEFSAADWRCIGPFPVWAALPTTSARLHVVCTVADHAVEMYAATPRHIEDDSGAVSIAVGDQTEEIPVSPLDAGLNLLWIVIKSGKGSASSTTGVAAQIEAVGNASVTTFSVPGSGHRYVENVRLNSSFTLRIDRASELVASGVSGDVCRDLFYQVRGVDSVGAPDADFDYGTLGSIRIKSVHLEFSTTVSLGQRWPWWRWYQFPSAVPGGGLLELTAAAHRQRMPSASWGAEPPRRIRSSTSTWDQQPGLYLAGDGFSASYATLATSRVWLDQDSRADRTRTVIVAFGMRFAGAPESNRETPIDVDFRITLGDGSTTSSGVVPVGGFSEPVDARARGDNPIETDRRILGAVSSSETVNERLLAETVSRTRASLDAPVWTVVQARVDASSLSAGHTLVTVEARGECGPWVMGPMLVQQVE